jgi:hypothetical protein
MSGDRSMHAPPPVRSRGTLNANEYAKQNLFGFTLLSLIRLFPQDEYPKQPVRFHTAVPFSFTTMFKMPVRT